MKSVLMMAKPLLILAALTLCCCVESLHALGMQGCQCLWTVSHPIPRRFIKKIEITPITGQCRRAEAIITRRNGSKVCVDPAAPWFLAIVMRVPKEKAPPASSKVSVTASTPASATGF